MKQNFTYCYIACLCAALFFSACADDWDVRRGHVIQEGVPVTVSLDFGVSASKVVTRAAQSDEAEQTVNRLYLFVFNSDGSLDSKQLYSSAELTYTGDCLGLSFSMHSGYDKRFYAIANPVSGSGTLTTDELAGVATEDELLALTSTLAEQTNIERSYFLMSGKMESATADDRINVSEDGNIEGMKTCETHHRPLIELERVDARITFKIKGVTPNRNYEDFTFVPDRYWVENIPQHTYVFPHDADYVDVSEGALNYASMSAEGEYGIQQNVEGQDENDYYYFEFYIAENRLQPKQFIQAGDVEAHKAENLYALREKRDKHNLTDDSSKTGQTLENGAFTYANEYSTYVVFHGILSYTDRTSGQQFVYADATYTVHLGETGTANDAYNVERINNYDTQRNTHYTYTVEITGIESMRVEVEDDRVEDRPGVEGDLIFSGEAVEEMDAHYGRTQFTLTRGAIKQGLSWAIHTPFQSGMKPFVDSNYRTETNAENEIVKVLTNESDYTSEEWKALQTDLNLNDYKWVQFLINEEAGFDTERYKFAKYPGYASYVGKDYSEAVIDVPAPPFGGTGAVPPNSDFYKGKNVVLYDVNQLLNHLYAEAYNENSTIFEGTGDGATVTITAFVDEYVYVYDPTMIYYRSPEAVTAANHIGIDLKLWKKVVNRDNRMLYLCTTGAIYSEDGQTSVSRNVFTIAQKPVYTFYNANDNAVTNGWGTESINETGPLGVNTVRHFSEGRDRRNTTSNGLINTWNVLNTNNGENLTWDEIMTLGDRDSDDDGIFSLNKGYDDIWHACIARNRDLNGDNVIQEKEVRWYLASIDQLTDLWIGENSVNEAARLYTWDYRSESDGIIRSHVASSSYNNGYYTNPWKIWAEEGASRGAYNADEDVNGTYTKTGNAIARNLWATYGSHVNPWNGENPQGLGLIHYRCVRNLGISLDAPETPFQPYVTVEEGTYKNEDGQSFQELVISLEKMEPNSIRSAIYRDVDLPTHTERSSVNRPYKKFAVICNNGYDENGTPDGNTAASWEYYQSHSVCPQGYRVPNQREMMLMYIYIPQSEYSDKMTWSITGSNGRRYVTGTGFSFKDYYYDTGRLGFMYDTSNNGVMFLLHDNDNGYVRCVRDVPD